MEFGGKLNCLIVGNKERSLKCLEVSTLRLKLQEVCMSVLKVEPKAVERLRQTLRETAEYSEDCLRIVVTQEGPELIVDQQRPEDFLLVKEDKLLLAIDPETLDHFDGRVLHVDEATSLLVIDKMPRKL